MTTTPAWQVITWPVARFGTNTWHKTFKQLRHLCTSVHVDASNQKLLYGQVLWGAEHQGKKFGMAWDWQEIRENIVILADPMTILSNLIFHDEAGSAINPGQRLILLNDAIFQLPWQRMVCSTRRTWAEALAA